MQKNQDDPASGFSKGVALGSLAGRSRVKPWQSSGDKPDDYYTGLTRRRTGSTGRYEEAIKAFDKTLEHEPGDSFALAEQGIAAGELAEMKESGAVLRKAAEIFPDNPSNLGNKVLPLFLGRNEEANAGFLKALQLRPKRASPGLTRVLFS